VVHALILLDIFGSPAHYWVECDWVSSILLCKSSTLCLH